MLRIFLISTNLWDIYKDIFTLDSATDPFASYNPLLRQQNIK